MQKGVLEIMFEMYMKEADSFLINEDANSLLTTTYINVFQCRNTLLWVQQKIMTEKARCYKVISNLKELLGYGNVDCINSYLFFSDIYKEETMIKNSLDLYENLLNITISNHNQVALADDMTILPYHYAVIQTLNYGIVNQDNYNDELFRKGNSYLDNEEYKQIYYDKSSELIPFIKSKLDNIIINEITGDDSAGFTVNTANQKNKRFPN